MSITSVKISGFQSHKNTSVKFHDGLNCIIGDTDSGKSALLRSLIWTITNKSTDKSFRTRGMDKTDVEITFSDNNEVSRVQSKSNAYYLCNPKTGVDLEYKAFKQLIPEDVSKVLNMSELNIASQFDQPFLLSDSPGEVARKLNQVSGLSDIDKAIGNIRKMVLSNSRDISATESILSDLEIQKESFKFIQEMEVDVSWYEKLQKEKTACDSEHFSLGVLISAIEKKTEDIKLLDCFLKAQTQCDAVTSMYQELDAVRTEAEELETCLHTLDEDARSIENSKLFLVAETEANALEILVCELNVNLTEQMKLTAMTEIILRGEGKIRTCAKNIENADFEFHSLMGKECILCGGKL